MNLPMPDLLAKPCRLWLLAAVLLPALPVAAQTAVLKGKDLTVDNLNDALAPPAGDAGPRTRSIKVRPTADPVNQAAQATETRPSASVLITFVTDSSELTDRARAALDVVGQALQGDRLLTYSFLIEGHADPRGSHDYNMRLSQARAESVVEYLVVRNGVARDRLTAVGKGDTELYDTQQIAAPENRRVTIVTLRQ